MKQGDIALLSDPVAQELLKSTIPVRLAYNDNAWPHKVLLVRGTATVQMLPGVFAEYATAAERYYGEAQGKAWVRSSARW